MATREWEQAHKAERTRRRAEQRRAATAARRAAKQEPQKPAARLSTSSEGFTTSQPQRPPEYPVMRPERAAKLLALADSPNPYEAQLAAARFRELQQRTEALAVQQPLAVVNGPSVDYWADQMFCGESLVSVPAHLRQAVDARVNRLRSIAIAPAATRATEQRRLTNSASGGPATVMSAPVSSVGLIEEWLPLLIVGGIALLVWATRRFAPAAPSSAIPADPAQWAEAGLEPAGLEGMARPWEPVPWGLEL